MNVPLIPPVILKSKGVAVGLASLMMVMVPISALKAPMSSACGLVAA